MRVTSPAVTIKAIWDALVADYGAAGTYGLLMETNLDAKVSTAKADLSTLETRLNAARAAYLDELAAANLPADVAAIPTNPALASSWTPALATALGAYTAAKAAYLDVAISSRLAAASYTAERGTDSALLAANYKQFTKGLTEHSALISRAYSDVASDSYADLLDVEGAGYLTGLWASLYVESEVSSDIVIEIDGAEVPPFTTHAHSHGNVGTPGEAVCFDTSWDANWKWILMCTPMYRFDSSLKIRVYNTSTIAHEIGIRGNATYVTE